MQINIYTTGVVHNHLLCVMGSYFNEIVNKNIIMSAKFNDNGSFDLYLH